MINEDGTITIPGVKADSPTYTKGSLANTNMLGFKHLHLVMKGITKYQDGSLDVQVLRDPGPYTTDHYSIKDGLTTVVDLDITNSFIVQFSFLNRGDILITDAYFTS